MQKHRRDLQETCEKPCMKTFSIFIFKYRPVQYSRTDNTTDNGCNQCTECIPDAASHVYECADQHGLCDDHGILYQCKTGKYLSCGSYYSWNFLFLIISHATGYFQEAFPKYDDLNASVQENIADPCRKGICKRRIGDKKLPKQVRIYITFL